MKTFTLRLLQRIAAGCVVLGFIAAPAASAAESTTNSAPSNPAWLHKSVVYEIFVRNFSKEGNFSAVTARLDELKDLGVDILWLMPIHPTGQKMKKGSLGSPYAVRDYYAIDPDCGTAEDFKRLIAGAHQRGMKVVMDISAGHTSWDSVMMAHPEFYRKDTSGKVVSPMPEWTDVAALNYESQELRRYMTDMLKYWVREFQVDGFRSDVAFTVPTEFWEQARAELEASHPNVIMLADANAKPELLAKAFNMDYSGALHSTLGWVMSGVSPASMLRESWGNTRQRFPDGALHVRFSDRHETPRAVARFGIPGALAAQVFMLTLDGVPMFYNGMEVGDATESTDPALFEKMPVNWNPAGRPALRETYRHLIKLRKQHAAFTNDKVAWLTNSESDSVVTFQRADDKNEFIICINFSNRPVKGTVELPGEAAYTMVKIDGQSAKLPLPLPEFELGGYEWRIYQRTTKE